jgi:sigma-B regulation protein RsbU (phosphoserine phosphatase)
MNEGLNNTGNGEEPRKPRALVADDQADILEALQMLLKSDGYHVEAVSSPTAVLDALRAREFDLLLMDLNYARDTTSGREGLNLVSHVRAMDQTLPIVVMTAWGSVELAVETMQRGVGDFVTKPWENLRLLETLRVQVERGRELRDALRQQEAEHAQQRRREQEYAEAREIQHALLPKEIPQFDGLEIAGTWLPARAVSGDYFNVLRLGAGAAALCIGDVAGKGMPAALLMSNLQAAVGAFATARISPGELCGKLNRMICGHAPDGKFITFVYALVDVPRRQMACANAGHNPPLVVHGDGSVARLAAGGTPLGVSTEREFQQEEIELRAGDRLVLFTDGITEAQDAREEEFGEDRLVELVRENRARSAAELQRLILDAVTQFNAGDLQDDATLVVVAVE